MGYCREFNTAAGEYEFRHCSRFFPAGHRNASIGAEKRRAVSMRLCCSIEQREEGRGSVSCVRRIPHYRGIVVVFCGKARESEGAAEQDSSPPLLLLFFFSSSPSLPLFLLFSPSLLLFFSSLLLFFCCTVTTKRGGEEGCAQFYARFCSQLKETRERDRAKLNFCVRAERAERDGSSLSCSVRRTEERRGLLARLLMSKETDRGSRLLLSKEQCSCSRNWRESFSLPALPFARTRERRR